MNYLHKTEVEQAVREVKTKFKKADILRYFGDIDNPTLNSDIALLRAMLHIFKFQTREEQIDEQTEMNNGVGFTGSDAKLLTSFSKQLIERQNLSEKQMYYVRKKMRKYANQIANHLNRNMIDKNDKIFNSVQNYKRNHLKIQK